MPSKAVTAAVPTTTFPRKTSFFISDLTFFDSWCLQKYYTQKPLSHNKKTTQTVVLIDLIHEEHAL